MYIHSYTHNFCSVFSERQMSLLKKQMYTSGELEFPINTNNTLIRSDEKVMRQDVKGSILIVNELIEKFPWPDKIEELALYVANGAFVEKTDSHLKRIVDVYKSIPENTHDAEKIRKIYRASPPLVALETLTNSTMSFIAQYTGIKGNNATFGNTSISALHALQEAQSALDHRDSAIVCTSNCGGDYSYLTNSSVIGHADNWKEGAGVAALILDKTKKTAKAKITFMKNDFRIPQLETRVIKRNWKKIVLDARADLLIHSGAYSKMENELDESYCKKLNKNTFSYFAKHGNMGPTNIIAGIIKAAQKIEDGAEIIDVLDRDIYGRETMIRIEKC